MFEHKSLTQALLLVAVTLGVGLTGSGESHAQAQMLMKQHISESTTEAAAGTQLLSGDLTAAERADLLVRLSDSEVRALLLQFLGAAAEETGTESSTSMLADFEAQANRVHEGLSIVLGSWPELPAMISFAAARLIPPGWDGSFHAVFVLALAGFLVVGAAAEWLFARVLGDLRRQVEQASPTTLSGRFGFLMLRFVLELLGIAVFGLAALGAFFVVYQGHAPVRLTVLTYVGAVVVFRIIGLASRFLLAPKYPQLRCLPFDDEAARDLHRCFLLIGGIGAFGFPTKGLLLSLDAPAIPAHLFGMMIGLLFCGSIIWAAWRSRDLIAVQIAGSDQPPGFTTQVRQVLARIWHLLLSAYVLGVLAMGVTAAFSGQESVMGAAIVSMLIVIAVPLLDYAIRNLLASGREDPDQPGGQELVVMRGTRILLVVGTVAVLAGVWGVNVFTLSDSGVGANITAALLQIGVTALIAYVGWEAIKRAIDRRVAAELPGEGEEVGAEGGGTGLSRIATLLPLFRKFLLITILTVAAMIGLSALGVDVGPLIAGAGLVGVAIGFGAQTLVKDVISGVFFLVDDAFRAGEYVDIGAVKGTVERINVRSLVLRHHLGPLHTIPFGEIQHLTNFSRDWVIMKLQFRVTYDTDVNKVKKIFKQIGVDMLDHEELGEFYIEPFKSQGVKAMEDSARASFLSACRAS